MKGNIIFWLAIFCLIFASGCAEEKSENIAIRINGFAMSADEFKEALKNSSYSTDGEEREKFLEDLINRKLILQEAERLGLDREQEFLKEIERFWEKTLLKNIISRESMELAGRVLVNEDEVRVRYDDMIKKGSTNESFEGLYDQIKWQLLREKQNTAFDGWLEDLRKKARIEVKKELLGIK